MTNLTSPEPRSLQPPAAQGSIRVGLTEAHGMAQEQSLFPPPGVTYSFLTPRPSGFRLVRSPIKGYLRQFDAGENDLIEAVLSPIRTTSRWIYSLACFQEAVVFNLLGVPVPRSLRVKWFRHVLRRPNFKKLIFWSQAGRETLGTYGGITDEEFMSKVAVVYPAIRDVPDELVAFNDGDVNLLFSGDFFRKGGVNVIDAFERAQELYPSIKLRVCCDERIDFNTRNAALKAKYLSKLKANPAIQFGRVSRAEMVNDVLPQTDVYLLPTYVEAFGFAILEAMAFGIPVISTNYFAIPEILEHGVSGFLIDTSRYDCDRLFRGYVVDDIPADFREHVTDRLFDYLCRLIGSPALRRRLGMAGVETVRTKFSFDRRNARMSEVYREALR